MAAITQHRFTEHIPLAGYLVRMQRDELPTEVNSALAAAAKAIQELGDRCDGFDKERIQWMSISFAVEEWMAGRISEQDLRETATKVLDDVYEQTGKWTG